jgi:hypothetical protein
VQDRPPYNEDFFQRIINVNWVHGAVFIAGCFPGICYFKVPSEKSVPVIRPLGIFDVGEFGIVPASSYANVGEDKNLGIKGTPTFLLAGSDRGKNDTGFSGTWIYASSDGLNWHTAYENLLGYVNDLVWNRNEKSFFASLSQEDPVTGGGAGDVCLVSANGYDWAEGGGDFRSHCEFGLPDGQYGYDEKHNMFRSVVDLNAQAVTFAGDVWAKSIVEDIVGEVIVNRSLFVSFDRTKTWVNIGSIPDEYSGIITICGGPLDDLLTGTRS